MYCMLAKPQPHVCSRGSSSYQAVLWSPAVNLQSLLDALLVCANVYQDYLLSFGGLVVGLQYEADRRSALSPE